jgi:hypothetical protein
MPLHQSPCRLQRKLVQKALDLFVSLLSLQYSNISQPSSCSTLKPTQENFETDTRWKRQQFITRVTRGNSENKTKFVLGQKMVRQVTSDV